MRSLLLTSILYYFITIRDKIFFSENILSLIFFIIKFSIFVGMIFYLKVIGQKIDKPEDTKVAWVVLFIPIYFLEIFALLYAILHSLSQGKTSCTRIIILISSLLIFSKFSISILIFLI